MSKPLVDDLQNLLMVLGVKTQFSMIWALYQPVKLVPNATYLPFSP